MSPEINEVGGFAEIQGLTDFQGGEIADVF
jgi:hypothetical protein